MEVESDRGWLSEIWERKIPQYLGSYLAIGFGLLQFLVFITGRYELNSSLVDKYLLLWLTLIPAIAILIYFKGEIQPSRIVGNLKWPQKAVIANIVGSILMSVFLLNSSSQSLDNTIELTNEEGDRVSAFVPSLNKLKTVASFQFENLTGDKDQDWLGVAYSHLLELDLDQRPEFYSVNEYSLYRHYNSLGLEAFVPPSLGMQRKIAIKYRNDYFTRVSYQVIDKQVVLKGALYRTQDGKSVVELDAVADDPFTAVDILKDQIVKNIPDALEAVEGQLTMPASTLITGSVEALEYLTKSRILSSKDPSKLEEVAALAKKAVEADPSCSLCHYFVSNPLYGMGRRDEAISYMRDAVKYSASLPDRMQFSPKEVLYSMTDNMEAYFKLQEMKRKMFPFDYSSYESLIGRAMVNHGIDSAKVLIQEAIENGNLEKGLLDMYNYQLQNEEYEEAEKTLDQLSAEFPDRKDDRLKYATLYEYQGRIEEAKEILLEEEALDPLNPRIQIQLAYLYYKNLQLEESQRKVATSTAQASSLTDSIDFMWLKVFFAHESGKIREGLEAMEVYAENQSRRVPMNRIITSTFYTKASMYLSVNQPEKISALVDEVIQYSPEDEAYYKCNANIKAIQYDYELILNSDEFVLCHDAFQSFGEGFVKYWDVMNYYLAKDYNKCVEVLDGDENRIKKLVGNDSFLARIYHKAGQVDKAKEVLQKVIDAKTAAPYDYYQMAEILHEEQDNGATEYLEIAMKYWANADPEYIPMQRAKALAVKLNI